MKDIAIIGSIDMGKTTILNHIKESLGNDVIIVENLGELKKHLPQVSPPMYTVEEYMELPDVKEQLRYAAPYQLAALKEQFIEGQKGAPITIKRETPKISRNAPCSCGSGKKNKRCCNL